MRTRVLDRNSAMNAVPLAYKGKNYVFADGDTAVFIDANGVAEVGYFPAFGESWDCELPPRMT